MDKKLEANACNPLSCSVCLEIMQKPVTIPCGHSFCVECVEAHWDNANRPGQDVSCPLCRITFPARPELRKNLVLCELLERWQPIRQVVVTEAPPSSTDVLCDFCTDEKTKAAKSCLFCMSSYCASHVQAHYRNSVFQNHQLVPPVRHIGSVCKVHLLPMESFCKTDQICICQECACQGHQEHEVVPAEQEKAERESQKPEMLRGVQSQIQELEANITKTRKVRDLIQSTVLKEKEEVQKHLAEAARILEKFQEEVIGFIESEEKSLLEKTEKYFRQLEVRYDKLRQQKEKVDQVPGTDFVSFIQQFQILKTTAEEKCIPALTVDKQLSFTIYGQAACTVKDLLTKECKNQGDQLKMDNQMGCTQNLSDGCFHSATSELRVFYLQYACDMNLDPETAERSLVLIGTKEVKRQATPISYPESSKRFVNCAQVLGKEELKHRSYWEVEVLEGLASVGVATQLLSRYGPYTSTRLGRNDASWCLCWHGESVSVCHNNEETVLSRKSSVTKLGIYLQRDSSNQSLTFYNVRGTRMIQLMQFDMLHFQKYRTLKLYPAFYLESVGAHLRILS
ncbi:E3 ubiquitin-protein ligase TRIM47 [Microcaecilia unicolor]|uniref:E3 ubiquitin-protein ligase TRIM47-like n=1 Tax=Microcaecilia unicolor TaxID=1415580 RepID=A0A6P7YM22_9AMPH|nr:E3 ubiquitin-protein ligase TRIM47-like [Microcaecilia unicolor]